MRSARVCKNESFTFQSIALPDSRFIEPRVFDRLVRGTRLIVMMVAVNYVQDIAAALDNRRYTNVDPVLHHAIDQIQVDDWL
jgi:hypothetical protein